MATVEVVDTSYTWYYMACPKEKRKMTLTVGGYECNHCHTKTLLPLPRYYFILFIKNIYSEDTDFSKYISVKQIVFSSFEENAGTISTDVQVVAKADFIEFKKVIAGEKNAIVDFISGLIPDTIYITSNFKISMQMSSPDQFLVESKSVLINNLTQEQSKSILELADKLLGASDLLPENINKTFAKVLFGGEDTQGLVDVVTGCSYFTFESDGTNIYLALKKA